MATLIYLRATTFSKTLPHVFEPEYPTLPRKCIVKLTVPQTNDGETM